MKLDRLGNVLKTLRADLENDPHKGTEKQGMPSYWVEFFLKVAAAGPEGVNTKEVAEEIGMTQAASSRMVKLMSQYMDPDTRKMLGRDIYVTFPDMEYLHRQRVRLSKKGIAIAEKFQKLIQNE